MPSLTVVPSVHAFGAAVASLEKAARWQDALMVLGMMPKRTLVACSAAVLACKRGLQWDAALATVASMLEGGELPDLSPDRLTWNMLLSACAEAGGGGWRWAMRLLGEMWYYRAVPNEVSYNVYDVLMQDQVTV
eukprot:TRINITY_DN24356_c0_g1_i4.p2 TRINITY_DN24356_c0_g1~~TRINITY_DN24356_c0_g1_i4.p2  ORF type:complete len:134 (-),score=24.64 TRINITY_DN24356_c0_g1_i4:2-403(-)